MSLTQHAFSPVDFKNNFRVTSQKRDESVV
jgi:hypothetical protein